MEAPFFYHPRMLAYDFGPHHPLKPERLRRTVELLRVGESGARERSFFGTVKLQRFQQLFERSGSPVSREVPSRFGPRQSGQDRLAPAFVPAD